MRSLCRSNFTDGSYDHEEVKAMIATTTTTRRALVMMMKSMAVAMIATTTTEIRMPAEKMMTTMTNFVCDGEDDEY